MDRGEFAKLGYEVRPGMNGSYVLIMGSDSGPVMRPMVGFTNAFDLLAFLKEDHTAHFAGGPESPND